MNNKTNIEEDIETTKEFIEYSQEVINDMEYQRPVDVTISQKEIQALENILANRENYKNNYDSLVEKIKEQLNKRKAKYKEILSNYGNIDIDITFNIPNKNVRKHLDDLSFEITILEELLETESKT